MIEFDPIQFAGSWIDAWNARDVEAVLAKFHDEAVFSSPIALRLGHGDGGTVRGKDGIRRYWMAALARNPDLHFRLDAVHVGTDTIVICFTTQDGVGRAEVLAFENGLVTSGRGTADANTVFKAPAS